MIGEAIFNSRPKDRVKPIVTLENPPPSNHPKHLSAWELPEVHNAVAKMNLTKELSDGLDAFAPRPMPFPRPPE